MPYSHDRIVTVASVRLTERESALISAWTKLAGTKVEAVASELMKTFIKKHVHLSLLQPPSEEMNLEVIDTYIEDNK